MIEIQNLCKRFESKILFDHFSCEIKEGEFVVFSGESGRGKTTLLNMIGGIESIDAGKIVVEGMDVSDNKNLMKLYRETFGFLFQNFALIEQKTVSENLLMIDNKYRNGKTVHDVLEKVGLAEFEKRKVYTLSGGEQQRVAIARLLMKRCSIVLADEPTGSLDRRNADIIAEHLVEINKSGKTIIMVTHDEKLRSLGSHVVEL